MKSLVKLKCKDGSATYINPEYVRGIRPALTCPGLTFVVYDPARMAGEVVAGTPEEVHAQLFPEPSPEAPPDDAGDSSPRATVVIQRTDNVSVALERVFSALLGHDRPWKAMQVARDTGRAEADSRINMDTFLALCANAFVDVTFTE